MLTFYVFCLLSSYSFWFFMLEVFHLLLSCRFPVQLQCKWVFLLQVRMHSNGLHYSFWIHMIFELLRGQFLLRIIFLNFPPLSVQRWKLWTNLHLIPSLIFLSFRRSWIWVLIVWQLFGSCWLSVLDLVLGGSDYFFHHFFLESHFWNSKFRQYEKFSFSHLFLECILFQFWQDRQDGNLYF